VGRGADPRYLTTVHERAKTPTFPDRAAPSQPGVTAVPSWIAPSSRPCGGSAPGLGTAAPEPPDTATNRPRGTARDAPWGRRERVPASLLPERCGPPHGGARGSAARDLLDTRKQRSRSSLGDRPMPCEPPMADPTEDVPPDGPLGQGDRDFELGALGLGVTGTGGVGAVVELTDQLHRPLQGMDAAIAVVADVHHAPAGRAVTVQDIEFPEGEIGILRPGVRHSADLHAVVRSRSTRQTAQELAVETLVLPALLRTIEKKWGACMPPTVGGKPINGPDPAGEAGLAGAPPRPRAHRPVGVHARVLRPAPAGAPTSPVT
jgi:hypothetical protein